MELTHIVDLEEKHKSNDGKMESQKYEPPKYEPPKYERPREPGVNEFHLHPHWQFNNRIEVLEMTLSSKDGSNEEETSESRAMESRTDTLLDYMRLKRNQQ